MINEIELLPLGEEILKKLPICFCSVYTKVTQKPEDSNFVFQYSRRYRSREFSVWLSEKPISKIIIGDHWNDSF